MESYSAIAEREPATCVWIAFATPSQLWGRSVWGSLVKGVRDDLRTIAQTIAPFCPVKVLVPAGREIIKKKGKMIEYGCSHAESARPVFGDDVTYVEIALDDLWIRDTGPIFVRDSFGQIHGVDPNFNGWGLEQPHGRDTRVAQRLLAAVGLPRVDTWLTMEGGALEFDGAGTVIVTDCSILNENRNPGRSEEEPVRSHVDIEGELGRLFGVTKTIWLQGQTNSAMRDITDGHVDFYARFVEPGHVVVHSDPHGEERDKTEQIAQTLKLATDARGHRLQVTTIEGPTRRRSKDFAASYLNFLIAGSAVIAPAFGGKSDRAAREQLSDLFPGREIELIKVNSLASGGGGVHCATLNQPRAWKTNGLEMLDGADRAGGFSRVATGTAYSVGVINEDVSAVVSRAPDERTQCSEGLPIRSVGLDIDGTITDRPTYFAELAKSIREAGGTVHVVSSRSPSSREETLRELSTYQVGFDHLFLLPNFGSEVILAPDKLNWYEKYLWQKVQYAQLSRLGHFFDDDPRVLRLFQTYAPEIHLNPYAVRF